MAERARVSSPNLYRFLKDDGDKLLRPTTLNRIAQAARMAPPHEAGGLSEGDARPFKFDAKRFSAPDPEKQPRLIAYEVTSAALTGAGFEAGDIAIIDTGRAPQPGNLVIAQVYDNRLGGAETVIRWYEPPFLVAASDDSEARRPYVVDNETVQVIGVVIRQLRSRDLLKSA